LWRELPMLQAKETAEKDLLAADERRWTRISDGQAFCFHLCSSAFISGQPVLAFFRSL
jgi:hypothetical protein